jgi:hypothetical protein
MSEPLRTLRLFFEPHKAVRIVDNPIEVIGGEELQPLR